MRYFEWKKILKHSQEGSIRKFEKAWKDALKIIPKEKWGKEKENNYQIRRLFIWHSDKTGWWLTWQVERRPTVVTGEVSTQDGNSFPSSEEINALLKRFHEDLHNFLEELVIQEAFVTTKRLLKSFPEESSLEEDLKH